MSTKTKSPAQKPKKKGPVAIAFEKIKALEEKVNAPHQCPGAKLRALPIARQYTGRVTMPSYGIPLPAGVGFHGYVITRLQDDLFGDEVVPPSEDDVMVLLRQKADQQFPGHVGVELADISVLPDGWLAEEE